MINRGLWLVAVLCLPLSLWAEEPPAPKVTLEFRETDVLEVLKLLAAKAGLNLVAGKNVTGPVTVFLTEVPVDDALEVVLAAGELAVERRGRVLTVMPQRDYELRYGQPYGDRRVVRNVTLHYAKAADASRALTQMKSTVGRVIADEGSNTLVLMDTPDVVAQMAAIAAEMDKPMETHAFPLNYGTVKAFAPLLADVVTKGLATVSVDERTNQVMVRDYPERLLEVARLATAFDERATEVLIEAKVVQVNLSDKFQLGIDWTTFGRDTLTLKGIGSLGLSAGGSLTVASAARRGKDYKLLIEALRTYGDTKILSEPRLTVVNNQEAKILVGSKEPYVTKSVSQTGTGTAVTSEAVNFIDVGIKLYVTPTIMRDRFVLMKVRPEVSSKTGTLTTAEKNEIPVVETSEAETVLLIEDGGTVILGGLIKDEKIVSEQRIPLLGDLPGVGWFFRSTQDTDKRTELVIFMTPTIVTGHRHDSLAPPIGAWPAELDRLAPAPPREPPAVADGVAAAIPPTAGAEYYSEVIAQVHAAAAAQSEDADGTVVVQVMVQPDGSLAPAPFPTLSTGSPLEPLARRAVEEAAPFPPFPDHWGAQPRRLKIPVRYTRRAAE
ncbi:MAG: TonB family protein [Candidatus Omnitrophica bacterium]|nr:TonB family protein [Candidatus Omnitrophota bacterium]